MPAQYQSFLSNNANVISIRAIPADHLAPFSTVPVIMTDYQIDHFGKGDLYAVLDESVPDSTTTFITKLTDVNPDFSVDFTAHRRDCDENWDNCIWTELENEDFILLQNGEHEFHGRRLYNHMSTFYNMDEEDNKEWAILYTYDPSIETRSSKKPTSHLIFQPFTQQNLEKALIFYLDYDGNNSEYGYVGVFNDINEFPAFNSLFIDFYNDYPLLSLVKYSNLDNERDFLGINFQNFLAWPDSSYWQDNILAYFLLDSNGEVKHLGEVGIAEENELIYY